jgi:hypothetical protein
MSLMHLLTMGRSFKGAKDGPSTYKMRSEAALPKFAAAKRPISLVPPTSLEKSQMQIPLFDQKGPAVRLAVVEGAPTPLRHGAAMNSMVVPLKVTSPKPKADAKRDEARSSARFWDSLKQFFFGRQVSRKASRPVVQTELALDKIAVIRNDLSDADLEVVTVERKRPTQTTLVKGDGRELAGKAWTRMNALLRNPDHERVMVRESKPHLPEEQDKSESIARL